MHDELIERIRQELAEIQQLSNQTADERAPVQLDQQSVGRLSRMDAIQGQALAQASDVRRQARIIALQAALRRFEDGDFGFCIECGEPISMPRLRADPSATLCIACAKAAER